MANSMNENSTCIIMAAATHHEIEKTLLQIWSEVLNTGDAGINDDFLSLGGDSLAAMRCINRINAAFGVELPLDLFLLESGHIAQVASEISRIQLDTTQIVPPEKA